MILQSFTYQLRPVMISRLDNEILKGPTVGPPPMKIIQANQKAQSNLISQSESRVMPEIL